jgi:hypothetical protein
MKITKVLTGRVNIQKSNMKDIPKSSGANTNA